MAEADGHMMQSNPATNMSRGNDDFYSDIDKDERVGDKKGRKKSTTLIENEQYYDQLNDSDMAIVESPNQSKASKAQMGIRPSSRQIQILNDSNSMSKRSADMKTETNDGETQSVQELQGINSKLKQELSTLLSLLEQQLGQMKQKR